MAKVTFEKVNITYPNAALANAVRKQPPAELFLMWSTLSYEDYLDSLPAGSVRRTWTSVLTSSWANTFLLTSMPPSWRRPRSRSPIT